MMKNMMEIMKMRNKMIIMIMNMKMMKMKKIMNMMNNIKMELKIKFISVQIFKLYKVFFVFGFFLTYIFLVNIDF